MNFEEQPLSGSDKKIQEYVDRINGGEEKESITKDLSPAFVSGIENGLNNESINTIPPQYEGLDSETLDEVWIIPIYTDQEKTERERENKKISLERLRKEEEIQKIRGNLGILNKEEQEMLDDSALEELVDQISRGRRSEVVELYKNLFNNRDNPEDRGLLIKALFGDVYNSYRLASYPINPDEEKTWEDHLKSTNVDVNNRKEEWMYRGVLPKKGEETITRGSFNVDVTPELISKLDKMIEDGKIKANYKFGQPGTQASPTERHDSISIYFLEQPDDDALHEIGDLIKPYVRGDNLLGKKIEDGFYMSEVGSIETSHIEKLIKDLESVDPALSKSIKGYTSPKPGTAGSLKMSEAQFYSIKDVSEALGHKLSYDKDKGFILD